MLWATDRSALTDIGNCRSYTQNCQDKFRTGRDYTFGGFDKVTGRFILISRLADVADQPGTYEFCGYWCRTSEQNKGYITEAVRAIAAFAFDRLQADKLMITHAAGNHATRAVMDKVGFIETDILKEMHALPDGRFVERHVLWLEKP